MTPISPAETWAYVENFGELFALNLVSGVTHPIALISEHAEGYDPTPSPNRTRVAWTTTPPNNGAVLLGEAGGFNPHTVSGPSDYGPFSLAWAPDGTRIAYAAAQSAQTTNQAVDANLVIVNADGTGRRMPGTNTIVNRTPFFAPVIAWGPDGTRIAFVTGHDGSSSVELVDVASGALTMLSQPTTGLVDALNWLPDGSAVIAVADGEVTKFRTDGAGPTVLTHTGKAVIEASVSPDGSAVAYYAGGQLLVGGSDGSPGRVLIGRDAPTHNLGDGANPPVGPPAWAPDGTALLIMAGTDADPSLYQATEVRIADKAVKVIHPLTQPHPHDSEAYW